MRWAARKDLNQTAIVNDLRDAGYVVDIRSEYGKPDLNVRLPYWPPGIFVQMETKTANRKDGSYVPTKSESKRREKQKAHCETHGVPYIKSAQDAVEVMDYLKGRLR